MRQWVCGVGSSMWVREVLQLWAWGHGGDRCGSRPQGGHGPVESHPHPPTILGLRWACQDAGRGVEQGQGAAVGRDTGAGF